MTSSPSSGPAHQDHDRLRIVALAAGDAAGADRERALAHVAACDSCRDLMTDLQAVTRAVASMPTISRPIGADFQLTVRDAHRLARGAWWRRALRPFGSTRGSILGPAAATMITTGLAGLILSAGSLLQMGATAAAPRDAALGPRQVLSEPAPASSGGTGGIEDRLGTSGTPMAAPSGLTQGAAPVVAAGPTKSATEGPRSTEGARSFAPAVDRGLLATVSGLLLIAGVGVLLLRRVAVRSP